MAPTDTAGAGRRHRWGEWSARGHGIGDGTPAGVRTSRECVVCGAREWRDTAVSWHDGTARPARGWQDAYGDPADTRPVCLGYDPLEDTEEAA